MGNVPYRDGPDWFDVFVYAICPGVAAYSLYVALWTTWYNAL